MIAFDSRSLERSSTGTDSIMDIVLDGFNYDCGGTHMQGVFQSSTVLFWPRTGP